MIGRLTAVAAAGAALMALTACTASEPRQGTGGPMPDAGQSVTVTAGQDQLLANCDPSAISADLGQRLNVIRCYDGWAYVDSGDLGDAQSLVRLNGDSWTRYTGFPSSICRGKALFQGVPVPELRSFSPC